MAKINLDNVAGGYNLSAINNNSTRIEDAFNNGVLWRNNPGGEPNSMGSDLDMDSNRIYNLPDPVESHEAVPLGWLQDYIQGGPFAKNLRVTDVNIPALPNAGSRANKLLSFDAQGNPIVQFPSADSATQLRIDLATDDGSGLIGWKQNGIGAVSRTTDDKLKETFSPEDFGAVGDAVTDDGPAIALADAAAFAAGKALEFDAKVYAVYNGITQTAKWKGKGSPVMGAFPVIDDKRFLTPTTKNQIPGTTLLFKGTGTNTITTPRSDKFSSMTYCLRTVDRAASLEGIGIVLDCDVYDAFDQLTTPDTDNRAIYDVGHVIDDAARCRITDSDVFGYFAKFTGRVVISRTGNDDPDYNTFFNCSTMGFALIGGDATSPIPNGLSGTQSYGCNFFAMDHHSRSSLNAAEQYADADQWSCIFIDVNTTVSTKGNGHKFFGGCVRTYANHPLKLDYCNNVTFDATVFEETNWGVPGSDGTLHTATVNTTDVTFMDTRHSRDSLFHADFAYSMSGQLITIGAPLNNTAGVVVSARNPSVPGTGNWTRLSADGASGDPFLQFGTGAISQTTVGWSIRKDVDASDILDFRYNGTSTLKVNTNGSFQRVVLAQGPSRVITAGAMTIGESNFCQVGYVPAATGDLATITAAPGTTLLPGHMLILSSSSVANQITVKDGTGNLRLSSDFLLSNPQDKITLIWDGTNWCEITRSDNS